MPLENPLFRPFPPTEKLLERIEFYKERNADPTTFMWHLLPLEEKFGERVYDVAAKSLAESGLPVTGESLRALARDMRDPANKAKYDRLRGLHIGSMITSYKQPKD